MLKIKKIKPLFNKILTTMDLYDNPMTEDGIIDGSKEDGGIREYQTVLAVGPTVKCVKPGDLIVINPSRYQIVKHKEGSLKDGVITDNPVIGYNFPILMVDDRPCLYLYDSDVDFVIKEWEESLGSIEVTDTEIVS
jgi:hypothetical protein